MRACLYNDDGWRYAEGVEYAERRANDIESDEKEV